MDPADGRLRGAGQAADLTERIFAHGRLRSAGQAADLTERIFAHGRLRGAGQAADLTERIFAHGRLRGGRNAAGSRAGFPALSALVHRCADNYISHLPAFLRD